MRRRGLRAAAAGVLAAVALVLACRSGEHAGEQGRVVRVAVLPNEAEAYVRRNEEPLLGYLAATTGFRFELAIPAGYAELLQEFHEGRVDLAWLGALTFSLARARSGAEPLVTRDTDLAFTSDFVVAADSPARDLDSLPGAIFSFGPPLSTSGHLMPRFFLQQRGIAPEGFFGEVRHSSAHDETVFWVRDGEVDVAAVSSAVLDSMFERERVSRKAVRILETTPPYQNYLWVTRKGFPEGARLALREAFLSLDPSDPEQAVILERLSATGFLPVDERAYAWLEQATAAVGLQESDP